MKQNPFVYDTIRQDVSVDANPRLIAEFSHNRYSTPVADNTPPAIESDIEPDLFPIESIIDGLRPRSGAVKATTEFADVAPPYSPSPPSVRQHIAEQEDLYKYWIGPDISDVSGGTTIITNLASNPSFETVDSLTEVTAYRNLAFDPRGIYHATPLANDVGWGASRGFGTGGAGNHTWFTTATDGPVGIRSYIRKKWTTAPSAVADTGFQHTIYSGSGTSTNTGLVVTGGTTYTFSSYLRTSVAGQQARFTIVWRDAAGAVVGTTNGTLQNLTQNQWTRIKETASAPATATRAQFVSDVDAGTNWPVGGTLDGTGLMITATANLLDYYDGTGAGTGGMFDSPDWQVGWVGAAQKSASLVRYPRLNPATFPAVNQFAIASGGWTSRGSVALRTIPNAASNDSYVAVGGDNGGLRLGMVAGQTYTAIVKCRLPAPQTGTLHASARRLVFWSRVGAGSYVAQSSSAAPNAAGVTELRLTFTVPAGSTEAFIRLHNGASLGNGEVWWDDFALVQGNYTGPYFDGDTSDEDGNSYAWTGTPHNSTSIRANGEFSFPAGTSTYPTNTNPQVTYPSLVKANKIVVGVENSVSYPTEYEIYVRNTVGGTWNLIGDETTITIPADGRITFYWNGTAWTQTRDIAQYREIAGIQMRVSKMSRDNRRLELIQMGAYLEWDLTPYLVSCESTYDLGDVNVMAPIGRISSNVGGLRLFNALVDENDYSKGLLFNNENTDSMFYGLTKENVKFTLDYLIDASDHGGGTQEIVRDFVMYAEDDWGSEIEEDFSISLRDASKFLQEMAAPETFYESGGNMSVGEIVWMLLDSVGWVDYQIDLSDVATPIATSFFWTDNDKKVWAVLNDLAEGTQTAIYFDEYGILQIKNKEVAFDPTATPVWHLRGVISGNELPDIATLEGERKQIPNTVKFNYKKVDYDRTSKNNIKSELVWEPEDSTVVLRSSDLQEPFMVGDEYFMILPHQAQDWQYSGLVNIEGEIVEYEGKEYKYLESPSTSFSTVIVKTHEEYIEHFYKTDTEAQPLNHFTGRLKVKERGMWNTEEKDHTLQEFPYEVWQFENGTKKARPTAFIRQGTESWVNDNERTIFEKQKSSVRLISDSKQEKDRYIDVLRPGNLNDDVASYMGTRFIIREAGQKDHYGGLCFSVDPATGAGYYVEVRPETGVTETKRAVNVGIVKSNGDLKVLNGKGWEVPVVLNKWHTLDVRFSDATDDHRIWVWLDGKLLGKTQATGSDKRTESDAFGMFIRGSSCYEFEYLYAYNQFDTMSEAEANWGEDVSFYDRVLNGYTANQSMNEFTSGTRLATRRVKKKNITYTKEYDIRFFDEFVPVVHEIRKFDVKYKEGLPGQNVRLLATNNATAKYIDFRGTPFGAQFYAVNVSHDDVVIHGDDEKLGVVSQVVKQGEEKSKEFKDEESVRVSGRKEMVFESDWIQSEGQVNVLGEWITSHWGFDVDEITVEVFGNPLLQITDVVYLTEPQSERINEKYYVIEVKNAFSEGLETTLRLRKVKS